MKSLFLSIITPTYNRANKLHIAFNSLMNQTNKNFEWIIVDDGSDDNTSDIVSKFIKITDFPIIYKKIKHGGKHIATRTAYKIASGKWSLELDSDDELYSSATIDDLHKLSLRVPKNYSCIGGRFIDQHDNIFPHIDGKYIDFDKDRYLEYFCDADKINTLNAPWLFRTEYAKSVLPPIVHDNLTYYPEAVINISRVLKCKDFHMRLFNQPWYRYYVYNADSVSVNTYKTNADWYYALGLLELFYKYNLLDTFPDFTKRNIKKLFNSISKPKTIRTVYTVLKSVNQQRYFTKYLIKYLVKQLFSVKHINSKLVITLFGIKIKGCQK